ncbi:hypothetical protein BJ508DRAFT_330706 [Ascobolus immersus RN42]|uniref:Uncharacterized protein n=1 Tax=Ascobolus immersus RN42 TaxID=1160509 RepID=A0A3N4HSM2_ASCIM|nr:hypothetical protein BJ508DRAFT_330706 [Ascobolus immersus RN42]
MQNFNDIFASGEEKGDNTNNHHSNPRFEDDMGYPIDRDIAVMKASVGVGYYASKKNSASKSQSPVTRAAKKTAIFKKFIEAIKLTRE